MRRFAVIRQVVLFTLQLSALVWAVRHTKKPERFKTAWTLLASLRGKSA